jgi:hypothetical protein
MPEPLAYDLERTDSATPMAATTRRPSTEAIAVSEDSLLERDTAAAEERQLSHNSLIAYRRT